MHTITEYVSQIPFRATNPTNRRAEKARLKHEIQRNIADLQMRIPDSQVGAATAQFWIWQTRNRAPDAADIATMKHLNAAGWRMDTIACALELNVQTVIETLK
jgi:hypothetical protein